MLEADRRLVHREFLGWDREITSKASCAGAGDDYEKSASPAVKRHGPLASAGSERTTDGVGLRGYQICCADECDR